MSASSDEPPPSGTTPGNTNVASGNSQVNQQINVQNVDTAYHYEATYQYNSADPPERKHEVALAHLAGGTPRSAERLLWPLLEVHPTTERAYYFLLAVFSERHFQEIQSDLADKVITAVKVCRNYPPDEWQTALDVSWRLFQYVRREFDGEVTDGEFEAVLDAFGALVPDRQHEILRHLDSILNGAQQTRLESNLTRRIVVERTAGGRKKRAAKFFEAEPTVPRKYVPRPSRARPRDWAGALFGGLGVVAGLYALVVGPFRPGLLWELPLLVVGGGLTFWFGIVYEAHVLRFCVKEEEATLPDVADDSASLKPWESSAFAEGIGRQVDGRFREVRRSRERADWWDYTAGYREHLKRRLVEMYWQRRNPPSPTALRWLIRWHAERVAEGWPTRGLFHHRETMVVPSRVKVLRTTGIALAASGLVAATAAWQFLPVALCAVGGFFAVTGVVRIAALRSKDEFIRAEAEELHGRELTAYDAWVEHLRDRPSDSEMARWLALDKAYIKADAIRRADLNDYDLVTHVVMTEGAVAARRGRVVDGPPRYEAYTVHVFLLTRRGMRAVRTHLDFVTGEVRNERRALFRYDTLASAGVEEKGSRTSEIVGTKTLSVENLHSREFRLTLLNKEEITVVAENFRNLRDSDFKHESDDHLARLAAQTSGIDVALPILEAVAAEGPSWFERNQERQKRWSRAWYE